MVSDALLAKSALKSPGHQNTLQEGSPGGGPVPVSTGLALNEVPKELSSKAENNKAQPLTVVLNGLPTTGHYQLSASGSIYRYQSVEKLQATQSEESKEAKRVSRRQRRDSRLDAFRAEGRYGDPYGDLSHGLGLGSLELKSSCFYLSMLPFSFLMPALRFLCLSFALERYRRCRRMMRDLFEDYSLQSASRQKPKPINLLAKNNQALPTSRDKGSKETLSNSTLYIERSVRAESTYFQFKIKAKETVPTPAVRMTEKPEADKSTKDSSEPSVESISSKPLQPYE